MACEVEDVVDVLCLNLIPERNVILIPTSQDSQRYREPYICKNRFSAIFRSRDVT